MKKMFLLMVAAIVWLLCPLAAGAEQGTEKSEDKPLLRAAIFIQNRAGEELQDHMDALNDQLTAGLTEKGFSIIDRNVVIAKFRESREKDNALNRDMKTVEQVIKLKKSEANIEDAVSGASALRIAQMIGADYIVVAAVNSLGVEARTFKGEGTVYGTGNRSTVFNLRMTLKVLEGNQGGSVYGDTVTASERIVAGQNLDIVSTDILPRLMESAAAKAAANISGKIERIRNVKVKSIPVVEFSVNSNVEGAVVELDGAVIGSTPGRFTAAPGLHQLRISKEWLSTWERTVNVNQNQQLNVTLELSEEGMQRYANIEQLKLELSHAKQKNEMEIREREAGIGIAKEQSEADAYAKKKVAEGEKVRREESYERLEGPPTTNLYK